MLKIRPERQGPPGDKHSWRKLNEGMSIEVAGVYYRRQNVIDFIKGAERAGPNQFGIRSRREPNNPHSPNGTATAIDGWWVGRGLLGGGRRHERHLGYLPQWASHQCLLGKTPEPTIFVELYSAYLGHDDFVDVDIIVHVERTADELAELEAARIRREARKQCLPGLKVLARVAMADGEPNEQTELNVMRNYVIDRSARLGLATHVDVEEIVEAVKGLAPSDQTVLSVIRAFASDDQALEELFAAALSLARSDGDQAETEVGLLKRMLASARRKRDKSS